MSYFGPEFIAFFEGLAKDNSKAYFDRHRKTYTTHVKEPFDELVADMILRMQEFDPKLAIQPKDAIFRINRDIRFSKDKTPYKTFVGAHIARGGRKDHSRPGLYFHLSHEDIMVGSGVYMVDREALHRIRSHIAGNPDEFARLLEDPGFKGRYGTIRGDANKRVPKEFQGAYEVQPLIANKQFYYRAKMGPDAIVSDQLTDVLMDHYSAAMGMNGFLTDALEGSYPLSAHLLLGSPDVPDEALGVIDGHHVVLAIPHG